MRFIKGAFSLASRSQNLREDRHEAIDIAPLRSIFFGRADQHALTAAARSCSLARVAGEYGFTASGAIIAPPIGATLARTTNLNLVWDENEKEARAIFLTAGTAITINAKKMFRVEED
jgi:hypothetical protein